MLSLPVSVLILTRNEEQDLPGCLQSVAWSDDVHVLDSISTDHTEQIARTHGAKFVQREFEGYASQRNFGLHQLVFAHPWVLMLDADERVPPALPPVLADFLRTASPDVCAARLQRRDYWWGRWLRHAQISPHYIRLVRPSRVHYEREINEILVVDGLIRDLPGHFDHFPFSKGLDHWIAKHNQYSTMEALLLREGRIGKLSLRMAMFHTDPNERRRFQKSLFYRLPGRPLLKFLYMVFYRRAFLDGIPGIRYAILQTIYEYFISLKAAAATAPKDEARRLGAPGSALNSDQS